MAGALCPHLDNGLLEAEADGEPRIKDIGLVLNLRYRDLRLCGIKGELSTFSFVGKVDTDTLRERLSVKGRSIASRELTSDESPANPSDVPV